MKVRKITIIIVLISLILMVASIGHLLYARSNFYAGHNLFKYSEFWSIHRAGAFNTINQTSIGFKPGDNISTPGNASFSETISPVNVNFTIMLESLITTINPLLPLIKTNWTNEIDKESTYKLFHEALENYPPEIKSSTLKISLLLYAKSNLYRILSSFSGSKSIIYEKKLQLIYNESSGNFQCYGLSNGTRPYIEFALNSSNAATLEIWAQWDVYVIQRYGKSLLHRGNAAVIKIIFTKEGNNSLNIEAMMKTYYAYVSLYIAKPKDFWFDYGLFAIGIISLAVAIIYEKYMLKKK